MGSIDRLHDKRSKIRKKKTRHGDVVDMWVIEQGLTCRWVICVSIYMYIHIYVYCSGIVSSGSIVTDV